jgi:hypothetical protein
VAPARDAKPRSYRPGARRRSCAKANRAGGYGSLIQVFRLESDRQIGTGTHHQARGRSWSELRPCLGPRHHECRRLQIPGDVAYGILSDSSERELRFSPVFSGSGRWRGPDDWRISPDHRRRRRPPSAMTYRLESLTRARRPSRVEGPSGNVGFIDGSRHRPEEPVVSSTRASSATLARGLVFGGPGGRCGKGLIRGFGR